MIMTTIEQNIKKGYKQTEVGVIPEDWEVKKIGKLSNVVRGGSPRPAGDPKYFNGNYISWLTVAALTNIPDSQIYVSETIGFLTEEGSKRSRTLDADTLIIANSGATLGVAKVLGIRCCANDGIAALVNVNPKIEKKYIAYYINTITKSLREVVATGNGQPNLNTELIGDISIPLPPTKAEQTAISNVLSDVDNLIGSLEKLIAKKRNIKQGAMQELLTGKKRLSGFSGKWEVKKLGDVVDIVPSGIYGEEKPKEGLHPYRVATTAHIDENDAWNKKEMALRFFCREQIAQYSPLIGDLIIVKSSGSAEKIQSGKVGYVSQENVGSFLFSNFLMLLRPISIYPQFLYYYLTSFNVKKLLPSLVEASTYPNIRIEEYLSLDIPFPPKEEQTAIANILSDMDTELEALEQKLDKYRMIKQGIMQELLTGKTRLI
ncbi:MAG: restriction endonuclease subunit S [Candidatus Zixiibacteriota bacterium]